MKYKKYVRFIDITINVRYVLSRGEAVSRVSDRDRTSLAPSVHFRLPTYQINEKSDSGREAFLVPRRARRDKSYSRRLLLTARR